MDINFIRGDSVVLTFRINDDEGNLIELEKIETLDLTARRFASEKSSVLFCKSKSDFWVADNQYLVNLEPEDTEQLSCTEFNFDIEITLKDGTRKTKICRVDMEKDYTIRKNNEEIGVKIVHPDIKESHLEGTNLVLIFKDGWELDVDISEYLAGITTEQVEAIKNMAISINNGELVLEYDDKVLNLDFNIEDEDLIVDNNVNGSDFNINENGELEVIY